MSFFYLVFSLSMLQFQVAWENDILEIKLHESIHLYEDLPQATLLINGEEVIDPGVYYEKGVERTFLQTVNTNIVRAYYIKYRVTFPKYKKSFTQTIIFNVVDDIPPTIEYMPTFSLPLNQKLPNLKEGLVYFDNYDAIEKLGVIVRSEQVILNRVGTYPIEFHVKDQSGNLTIGISYVTIYDHIPPEISLRKPLVLPFGSLFDWRDFFVVKDNYDTIIHVYIDDAYVDYSKIGSYPLSILARDQSGLETKVDLDLTIVDLIKPHIAFKSNLQHIFVHQEIDRFFLESFMLHVSDNYDTLDVSDVLITHDIDVHRLGDYLIYFSVSDSSLNRAEYTLKVKVVDQEKPTINQNQPLVFEVGSTLPFWNDFFDIFDNYDTEDVLKIKISGVVNMHVLGIYHITVEAIDTSKNVRHTQFKVEVIDQTPPVIVQNELLIINDFSKIDIIPYFHIEDNDTKYNDLIIKIHDDDVKYTIVGVYDISICVMDKSKNESCLKTLIEVVDKTCPIITLSIKQLTIEFGETIVSFKKYISSVSDDYSYVTIDDVIEHIEIDVKLVGLHKVTFSVYDESMNKGQTVLFVYVDVLVLPQITYENLSTHVNQSIDLFKGIHVSEHLIAYEIFNFDHINFSTPGKYMLNYAFLDERGNHFTFQRSLTIYDTQSSFAITSYIPVALIMCLSIGGMIYVYKKQ